MDESLVKLCGDEVIHAKFKQLYGEKPVEKTKALKWEYQKLAFFLAWDISRKASRKALLEEIQEYYGTESSIWSMCEDCESTVDGHKIKPDFSGIHNLYMYEKGSPIYPESKTITVNLRRLSSPCGCGSSVDER